MLIVQVCDFGHDGDARYRVHDPSRALGALPDVTTVDCHFLSRFLPELIERADVLVLQFVMDWDLTGVCLRRRAAGKLTIFEANDYFFDLQPWNPIAPAWQDRNVQELYLQLLKLADGVQTSTPELARRWNRLGARAVAVFPNHLTSIPPLSPSPSRPLTIGWAGSPGHLADLYHIAPLLQSWLDDHPHVHLAIMTTETARPFFHLAPDRYHFDTFGSLDAYLQFLQRIDIGLAPLLPTDYNRCRSDVKFLEYAAQGVAGIYAELEPYRGIVQSDQTGLFYRTPQELIGQLDRLHKDQELRNRIRCAGYAYVKDNRQLRNHIVSRLDWYKSLLPNPSGTSSLPSEIAIHGVRDAGYIRLPPQGPERAVRDALNQTAPAQASAAFAQVLEQSPRYLAALQHQGRLLNDLRQHRTAIELLERAREIEPENARTLAEIGRAWYRLDNDAKALAALDLAITFNPHYLPAWQYLLRLLAVNKDPAGPRRAMEASQLFPACYPLALLGAATYPPAQIPTILLNILEHHAPLLDPASRITALPQFRDPIVAATKAAPQALGIVELLHRACEVFPESARLASELGSALLAAGQFRQGLEQQARALSLKFNAKIAHDELGDDPNAPLPWRFAQHIQKSDKA